MNAQEKAYQEQIREFLRKLDACKTEDERIAVVSELIFGIIRATRRMELEAIL